MRKVIFAGLLGLIVVAAIPYGTIEAWWKAAFVFAAFGLCILAIIEIVISRSNYVGPGSILLPLFVLAGFAYIQTISLGDAGLTWRAFSADPYQTRFFVLQILGLTCCLALL